MKPCKSGGARSLLLPAIPPVRSRTTRRIQRVEILVALIALGQPAPSDPREYRYIGSVTRGETTLSFESDIGGMQAQYLSRWVSTSGAAGTWSETTSATVAAQWLLHCAMNLIKHAWLVYLTLAAFAIAAAVVGEVYDVAWAVDWLAPILTLLCFVSLSTLSYRPDPTASTGARKFASYAKMAAFAGLIYLFISIDLVSDAPVSMRLMGMSWTMSPYAATRVLTLGGLVIGAIAAWMAQNESRRAAAAAALAKGQGGQAPPAPPPP